MLPLCVGELVTRLARQAAQQGLQTEDENMHAWVCVHERVYGYVCAQVCMCYCILWLQ